MWTLELLAGEGERDFKRSKIKNVENNKLLLKEFIYRPLKALACWRKTDTGLFSRYFLKIAFEYHLFPPTARTSSLHLCFLLQLAQKMLLLVVRWLLTLSLTSLCSSELCVLIATNIQAPLF